MGRALFSQKPKNDNSALCYFRGRNRVKPQIEPVLPKNSADLEKLVRSVLDGTLSALFDGNAVFHWHEPIHASFPLRSARSGDCYAAAQAIRRRELALSPTQPERRVRDIRGAKLVSTKMLDKERPLFASICEARLKMVIHAALR
jgi:hypothetical protein